MPVPITYRKTPEGVTANYDFIDILSKTGSVRYYTCTAHLSGQLLYFLNTEVIDTPSTGYQNAASVNNDKYVIGTGITATTETKSIDIDIDSLQLTVPAILQGTFVASIAFGLGIGDSASYGNIWIKAILKKLATNGTTETDLLTLSSNVMSNDAGASSSTYADVYAVMKGDVSKTKFKIGEKIRITLEFYGTGTAGKTITPVIYLDPNNAAITIGTSGIVAQAASYTSTEFIIPFRIDL